MRLFLLVPLTLTACENLTDGNDRRNSAASSDEQAARGAGTAGAGAASLAAKEEPHNLLGSPVINGDAGPGGSTRRILEEKEVYYGSGKLAQPAAARAKKAAVTESGDAITLNFVDVDIREFVDVVLGDTLKVDYVIDPNVGGTITVRTSRPIPRSVAIPVVEEILSLHGTAIVFSAGVYSIVPLEAAASSVPMTVLADIDRGRQQGYGVHIIPLKFAAATAIQEILTPFIGAGRVLRVDEARNLLIFAGPSSDAHDLTDMVSVFDVDWMAGMSFALFPTQIADPKDLVADLEEVLLNDAASPLAGVLRFVPIERLNAILVISPQRAYIKQVETWIDRLDRGADGSGRRIFVYPIQNGRAADLAAVLEQIFSHRIDDDGLPRVSVEKVIRPSSRRDPSRVIGTELGRRSPTVGGQTSQDTASAETSPGQDYPSPDVRTATSQPQSAKEEAEDSRDIRIIADEINNALVILANSAEYRMIESTLSQLDITPLQVLIEATIAEVALNDDLRYGLEWFFSSGDHSVTFSTLDSGAVSSAFPGFSYLFAGGDARVVLNALTKITDIQVISSPQLMVLDNQSARLQVGDQVPVATQSAVSVTDPAAPVVNSIQYLDTGVILEVTPRVNKSGLVTLDIIQEVSDVIETTTSNLNSPTIQQRSIASTVAVQSGDTIALGGLIRDSENEAVTGVPLVSEIPLLGNLFKTTETAKRRTELLILLTPRVVRDRRQAQDVTNELRRRLSTIEPLEKKIKAAD